MASEYDTVVVFCGNNDLSQHPFKPSLKAESRLQVATSLCSFKHELELRNPYINVKTIRLLLRPMLTGLWCKAPIQFYMKL